MISNTADLTDGITNWQSVWSLEQWQEKKLLYPWLFCLNGQIGCEYCRDAKALGPLTQTGVALSKPWSNAEIDDRANNKSSTRLITE